MKKIKYILTTSALGLASLFAYANNLESQIQRYEQANFAVNYHGDVGSFLQLLSAKLGIGYYSENINPLAKVKIKQDKDKNLSSLIEQLNSQLAEQHVLLNSFNDKVTLALVSKNRQVLQVPQYIGEINFNDVSLNSELAESIDVVGSIRSHSDAASTTGNNSLSSERETLKMQEEKMNSIVALSQDEKLMAKYKRKPPQYKIENQEAVKLETIRSTKISTFLVFQDGVNAEDYQIEGKFQDIAKLGNLVAILHRQKEPPKTVKISKGSQEAVIRKVN